MPVECAIVHVNVWGTLASSITVKHQYTTDVI